MTGSLQGAYLEFEACRGSSSAFEPPSLHIHAPAKPVKLRG